MLFTPVNSAVCIVINRQNIALCIPYVPGGKSCRCFAYTLTCRVVSITDGARGFVNTLYFTVNTPGNAVYPVITRNARLRIIDQVANDLIPVIGGVGLVP